MGAKCPKCGSNNTHAHKKGFSGKKAVAGAIATGGIGVLAGTIGSNKIKITCLDCSHTFNPGANNHDHAKSPNNSQMSLMGAIILFVILTIIGSIITYNLYSNEWYFFGTVFLLASLFCLVMAIFSISQEIKN